MAIDDRSRSDLLQRLDEVLGPDIALILMNHVPPTGWRDVATVHDLENQSVLHRSDLAQLGAEIRSEMTLIRSDLDARTTCFGPRSRVPSSRRWPRCGATSRIRPARWSSVCSRCSPGWPAS